MLYKIFAETQYFLLSHKVLTTWCLFFSTLSRGGC